MTKKRKRRKGITIVLCLLLVLLLGVLGGLFWYKSALSAPQNAEGEAEVVIEQGETYQTLLDRLEEDGIIRSALAASIYSRLHDETGVYEGTYRISRDMSAPEVLQYLADPANMEKDYAVVTVPEGYWAKQIAALLGDTFEEYTAADFLDLWNDNEYINTLAQDYEFLDPSQVEDDQYFVKLEGYLFPETYYIDYGLTPDAITRIFLDQFDVFYQENKETIASSGLSVQEMVTLASIVQFESGSAADMPDIAGVFFNRLERGMMLQSSVTVCYALYDDYKSAEDCETNTHIDSPYNTYQHAGLPIGPILNPGALAMEAVLHPAQNDYLYFVADIYGDGSVHYAQTLEEHEANVDKYNLRIE